MKIEDSQYLRNIVQSLTLRPEHSAWSPSDDLFEAGVLDSMGFVLFVLRLEEGLGIAFDHLSLDPKKLSSLAAVESQLRERFGVAIVSQR